MSGLKLRYKRDELWPFCRSPRAQLILDRDGLDNKGYVHDLITYCLLFGECARMYSGATWDQVLAFKGVSARHPLAESRYGQDSELWGAYGLATL
ncbi:hypothetical protein Slin15195_G025350 [Septoria linicola]|uniref:Uncharacterized protein n=1 Tax=Septoria linicola TaxID=215465 RepID=A0A9Q9EEW6_9PEZI|nr:hypothetical protein Slin14017_G024430 [Septoria linicola]USW49216.1 hypothetical protein Slin15195_G025350 [Septoria linicola]